MNILDAYPKTQQNAVSTVTANMGEALDAAAKAQIVYDDAFERFQLAVEEREPEEKISRLREESEKAAGDLDAAKLDYQEVNFVYCSMWN